MTDYERVGANTPVLVGAGQEVEREARDTAPMALAAAAARAALADAGGRGVAAAIDTVCVTRLFTDSMGIPPCPFGRCDNPPRSVARAIGAEPRHAIYGQVGGNEPVSRLIEFARDIARGEREAVLLAGAEAMRNQRSAEREGRALDWNETVAGTQEDRGWGEFFVSRQEASNGLLAPVFYFALIEQAQAAALGRSPVEHRLAMARQLAPLSEVAAANPYAQFPSAMSAEELLSAPPLNHLYTRRMIAQDGVNQGAALLLCSVGAARRLGIPPQRWVFLHGLAEGVDVNLSEREDPARSAVAGRVLARCLELAGLSIDEIGLIDLYSCFPCAVAASADALGLPLDGSRSLTLTGGLPFFGGPGNNYSMHALAEAVVRLHADPGANALVYALGGMLSKHAAAVLSGRPSSIDWARLDTRVAADAGAARTIIEDPGRGRILSYVLNYRGSEPVQAMILAATGDGGRFVATGDAATAAAMLAADPTGRCVSVSPPQQGALHFTLEAP